MSEAFAGEDAFIEALRSLFADRARGDQEFAATLYCAITQVTWTHEQHGESGFSYRAANEIIFEITGQDFGFYMEPGSGKVAPEIEAPLFELGWHHDP